MDAIKGFTGEYRWLSNFWPVQITMGEIIFPSVEHAYQAAKTLDLAERNYIRLTPTARGAKRLGKKVTLRDDWDDVKLEYMKRLVYLKFQRPDLAEKLLATGNAEIIEENYWNDTYWGVCKGIGENHLGKILMDVRNHLAKVKEIEAHSNWPVIK